MMRSKNAAWVLLGLHLLVAVLFTRELFAVAGIGWLDIFSAPNWVPVLFFVLWGVTLALLGAALWAPKMAHLVLIFSIHVFCPLLFFTDFTRNPYFTQITLLNIWVSILVLSWVVEGFLEKKWILPRTPLDIPLLIWVGVLFLSWGGSYLTHRSDFHSPIFYEGLRNMLFVLINVIAVFYLAQTLEEKWQMRLIAVIFAVGAIAAFYGLMQYAGIESIWRSQITPFANRPVSTFGNPNFLSSYLLLLVAPLLAAIFTVRQKRYIVFSLLMLLIVLMGIIATMTRSTWVGLIFIFLLFATFTTFWKQHLKNFRRIILILLGFLAMVAFWPKSSTKGYQNPWQRVMEFRNIRKSIGSYQPWDQRMLIWSSCWLMVKDHLLLGKGWGALELFFPYYQGRVLYNKFLRPFRTHANNAHNELLEYWVQTGTIGTGIFIWIWVVFFSFLKRARSTLEDSDLTRSAWIWAFCCSALGMLVDNFFGNVSVHFAVPGMLFWWQSGTAFHMTRVRPEFKNSAQFYEFSSQSKVVLASLFVVGAVMVIGAGYYFLRQFQEVYYFRGFKTAKSVQTLEMSRAALEKSWKFFNHEVNANYELSNIYARISQESRDAGLSGKQKTFQEKAYWAYLESLNSNSGYDEIYFNLASIQAQLNHFNDPVASFKVQDPNGREVSIGPDDLHGSFFNFSRSILINPLSYEAFRVLGGIYMRNLPEKIEPATLLYERAVNFFPNDRDFWLNLNYLYLQQEKNEEAYQSIHRVLEIDPTYSLARRNLRALCARLNRKSDPLLDVDQIIERVGMLVVQKQWKKIQEDFTYAESILPNSFYIQFVLANTYFELRNWDEAIIHFKKALEISPDNEAALANLALTYQLQGNLQEAIAVNQRILGIHPNSTEAQNRLKYLETLATSQPA